MKNKYLVMVSAVLALAALTGCIPQPLALTSNTVAQIHVSGVGEVAVVPDLAYINLGVHSQAEEVSEAFALNNAQAQKITKALADLGVDEKDIQTSTFNIYPQQIYPPQGLMGPEDQGTTVYVVENTVFVTVRDLRNLSNLLNAVVTGGANNIYGIRFDISNRAEAEKEARRLAVEDAKAQAMELAQLSGVELGDVVDVRVYSSSPPMPLYEGDYWGNGMAQQAPTSAGQLTLTVNAEISYGIR